MTWDSCEEEGCLTRYGMRRMKTPHGGPLICEIVLLEICRDILEGPMHPSWLAQMERDYPADDKRKPEYCSEETWGCRGGFCVSRLEGLCPDGIVHMWHL